MSPSHDAKHRSDRRSARPRLMAALLAFLLALVTIGSAQAHANLVRSNPPSGATLAAQPARIQLWFSEELEPAFSQAVVYDANRQRVDANDSQVAPDDPTSLILGLNPNLPNGTYIIAWTTSSKVDGHVIRGVVPFGIGVASAPPDAATIEAAAPVVSSGTPFEMGLRWAGLLSAALLVGSFGFWLLQSEPLRRLVPESVARRIQWNQTGLAAGAALVFLLATLALLTLQAAITTDQPPLAALGRPLLQVATGTRYGQFVLSRWFIGAILGGILILRARRTPDQTIGLDRLGLLGGFVLLAGISLTSHSAASATATPLGILPLGVVADWIHLAAAAIWIGGLTQLSLLLGAVKAAGGPSIRARFLGSVVPRFSLAAAGSLLALGATGLAEALIHVGTLENLLNTAYGQALLIKILLIFPLLTLAAINHFLVRPTLLKARAATSDGSVRQALGLTPTLRSTVLLETLLIASIMGAVGVMTSLSPAQQPNASAGTGPLTLTGSAADLTITLAIAPGRPGPNRYLVDVHDASGQPDASANRVTLRLTYQASDLGTAEVGLTSEGTGRFIGSGQDLAVSGPWQAEVIVRRPGHDDTGTSFAFAITPAGASVLAPPQPELTWRFALGLLLGLVGILAIRRGVGLRRTDLWRAAIVAVCGIGIIAIGGYFAVDDVQQAQALAASKALAQSHPATPESLTNGAAVYRQDCAQCHGPGARGNGPLAASLNPRPSDLVLHVPLHPDRDLENWIANGFPGSAMPAFKDRLTEQERWDLVNYLRSLAEQGDPTQSSP